MSVKFLLLDFFFFLVVFGWQGGRGDAHEFLVSICLLLSLSSLLPPLSHVKDTSEMKDGM